MKPISFYQWLAKTGQLDMDFYQPCNSCDGEGYTIEEGDYEVGYRVTCESCKGTGNALYREYLRQVEEDKKLLNAWICQNMQLSQANVSDKGGKVTHENQSQNYFRRRISPGVDPVPHH